VFDYEETSRKSIQVAGGRCLDGLLEKKSFFRVVRNGQVVYDRETCKAMKHHKNDVNSIKRNVEFGLSFDNDDVRIQPGDRIKCYTVKMVKRPIEWDLGF
jgi:translation initiation factor IF-2